MRLMQNQDSAVKVPQPVPGETVDLTGDSPQQPSSRQDEEESFSLIRSFAQGLADGKRAEKLLSPDQLARLRDTAKNLVPRTLREAVDCMEVMGFGRYFYRPAVRILNVKNASDLRQVILREIIASKIVQRQCTLATLIDCVNEFDLENPPLATAEHARIRNLPITVVRGRKYGLPQNKLYWQGGDLPLYDPSGQIVPGQPPLPGESAVPVTPVDASHMTAVPTTPMGAGELNDTESANNDEETEPVGVDEESEGSTMLEQPDFQPVEYCRLLHVLAEKTLAKHLAQLVDPELKVRPWSEHVAPLFNDANFSPQPVNCFPGGVTLEDIRGLSPKLIQARDGETLQQRFAEFALLYRAAVRSYVQWGNEELDSFSDYCQGHRHIAYAFCLLEKYPDLDKLTLKVAGRQTNGSKGIGLSANHAKGSKKRKGGTSGEETDDELANGSLTPVAKRARAAMLQDTERAELSRIIAGGIPGEVGGADTTSGGRGLTKSEAIQEMEKAERDRAIYDTVASGKSTEGILDVLRMFGGTYRSPVYEEIERLAREKAITETNEANVKYTASLIAAMREANNSLSEARNRDQRKIIEDVLEILQSKLQKQTV